MASIASIKFAIASQSHYHAAYNETAVEDKEIYERMHRGLQTLFKQGLDERGPYRHPMETGLEHFHQWMRQQLTPHLPIRQL